VRFIGEEPMTLLAGAMTERQADQTGAEERTMAATSPKSLGGKSPAKSSARKSPASKASAPKSLGKDLEAARRGPAEVAIHRAISELSQAVETGRTDADAMLSAASAALTKAAHIIAEETQQRAKALAKITSREVHEHPVRTTAVATAIVAAVAGLVLAIRQAPRKLLR
jgi:ElaB/YqjD/DUF883 family membrane-anchored ribosome-binding protein